MYDAQISQASVCFIQYDQISIQEDLCWGALCDHFGVVATATQAVLGGHAKAGHLYNRSTSTVSSRCFAFGQHHINEGLPEKTLCNALIIQAEVCFEASLLSEIMATPNKAVCVMVVLG